MRNVLYECAGAGAAALTGMIAGGLAVICLAAWGTARMACWMLSAVSKAAGCLAGILEGLSRNMARYTQLAGFSVGEAAGCAWDRIRGAASEMRGIIKASAASAWRFRAQLVDEWK